MSYFTSTRRLASVIGVAFLLSIIVGCNSDKKEEAAASDSTHTNAVNASGMPGGPTLSPAPSDLAADTIPLRAPDGGPTRYGLASGRIIQEYRGGMKGNRAIVFDHYGMRERGEDLSAPYPEGRPGPIQNSIFITRRDTFGRIELRSSSGWKTSNSADDLYLASDSARTMSLGAFIMAKSPGKRLADTTINGYQCKVIFNQRPGIFHTVWVWRGITLREHFIAPQDTMEFWIETTELKPNIDLPDSVFNFPAGIKMQEMPEPKPGQPIIPPSPQPPAGTPHEGGMPGGAPPLMPGQSPMLVPMPPMPNPK